MTGGTGSEVLLRESDGGILTLTLHRPEAYNAIDTQLRDALLDALVLALGADHCVAASDARLSAPFVARALVPDGASIYLLPRLVGTARARRMLLFGEDVAAPEAFAAGMIGEVVEPDALDGAARARAERLAALPASAIQYTKSMLQRSFELDLESALLEERAGQALMSTTDDYAEGRAAFLERRPPRFGSR